MVSYCSVRSRKFQSWKLMGWFWVLKIMIDCYLDWKDYRLHFTFCSTSCIIHLLFLAIWDLKDLSEVVFSALFRAVIHFQIRRGSFLNLWIPRRIKARIMCKTFSLVPSKKPVTRENWDKLSVFFSIFKC